MGNPDLNDLRKHAPPKGAQPPPASSQEDWEAKFNKAASTAKGFIGAVFWAVLAFFVLIIILALLFGDSGSSGY